MIYEINSKDPELDLQVYKVYHNIDDPTETCVLSESLISAIEISIRHYNLCYSGDSKVFKAELLGESVIAGFELDITSITE